MKYFRYTLDELKQSSDRKLFDYISFFAGGGGSSAGYKLAGGDCKFVNEFQQVAVDTYLENWPETPAHICGDIKEVTGAKIMEMTGIKKGELDILDGSPPCPPFSMSGTKQKGWGKEKTAYGMKQKNIEDLTWEQIRIAGEMMPKIIICENVKGLTMEYAREHLMRMGSTLLSPELCFTLIQVGQEMVIRSSKENTSPLSKILLTGMVFSNTRGTLAMQHPSSTTQCHGMPMKWLASTQ